MIGALRAGDPFVHFGRGARGLAAEQQVIAALEGLVPDAPADLRDQRLAVEGWMLGRPA